MISLKTLYSPPILNPTNKKSLTLPILNLRSQHIINFHLSWIGFFSAFLAWFAFPPLLTLSIRNSLNLTQTQVSNSNILALLSTLLTRLITGPLVDAYGPRITMAALLLVGVIPSGLAGTANSAGSLYAVRFFVGILGATFVPCQAWTAEFFDDRVVGLANAIVAGWGNAGGGVTYAVMVALFDRLQRHMSENKAWRVAFVAVPVPVLLFVGAVTLLFGTDHPMGKWREVRHRNTHADADPTDDSIPNIPEVPPQQAEPPTDEASEKEKPSPISPPSPSPPPSRFPITLPSLSSLPTQILIPSLSYLTTFGFELSVDSTLASVLLGTHPELGQLRAGYLAVVFGILNVFTRPVGGALGDFVWTGGRRGERRQKDVFLGLATGQGVFSIIFGKYIQSSANPSLGALMVLVVMMSLFNGMANGANFAYVPHCCPNHPRRTGTMIGIVGAFGNLGGVVFSLIFRFQPKIGVAWVISGIFTICVNGVLVGLGRAMYLGRART